ncbi:MAG: AraC family transcriptional regulator [Albidovulum sp.]|nr:AraC family transcriptional regulator [Albidovulum sp.]
MLTFPVPIFGALVLGFLFLRLCVLEHRAGPLSVLIALCALQSLVISLAQHYQVPGTQLIQPITAMFIPAAAWLAFATTMLRRLRWLDIIHALGPVCAVLALNSKPAILDLLIPGTFLGYGTAIALICLRRSGALPQVRLENGNLPAMIWTFIAMSLGASASIDVLIAVADSLGAFWLTPWFISGFSAANLLLIGALGLTGALRTEPINDRELKAGSSPADTVVMKKLEELMRTHRPYLNPDLTLMILARKTGIPAKRLSSAINRSTGQNVSRYVNNARIAAAQTYLAAGENVTAAMLSSGFNTKSNFNREFLRVTGMNPTDWTRAFKGGMIPIAGK